MSIHHESVQEKIRKLKEQTTLYVDEMKRLVKELDQKKEVSSVSYFTTSLNISYDADQESLCLGSYHIRNIGNQPLTNPYICIKLPDDSPFSFSGRYVYEHFNQNLKVSGSWERIHDTSNKTEFWLKPIGKPTIEPNETISFTNFQIKWSHHLSYAGTITGFTYCDELQDGVLVINPINLNGMSSVKEGQDE
ncbi:hypothetical protein [Lysinibacillus varians]|uniref:Uncharacterized protein n=1 Tax=Lysinibacillus varians TaxID=1145276 RepID=A0ABY2T9I1_9BACI|nr:hypothetical protein [Lysinibacillus varians]AHN23623.1 hypothetical protein T479_22100 [Lysinibacillus varians]TKI62117.1 hypothetical protein FC752_13105 [Lysinibacillus varians]